MKIIILSGYGLNCEDETAFAFGSVAKHLGVLVNCEIVHISKLMNNKLLLRDAQVLVIPGGFSFADHSGAGNALAFLLKNHLLEEIQRFIDNDKLVIGICNGCQVLIRLLPIFANVSLRKNVCGTYVCKWVKLKVNSSCSPWLRDLEKIVIPVAHGEGQFVFDEKSFSKDNIALSYIPDENSLSNDYNPNGSYLDTAAITDSTGRVLAIMPHPERALFFSQRPDWTLRKALDGNIPTYGDGFEFFRNAIKHFN